MNTYDSVRDNELEGRVFVVPKEFGGRDAPIHSGYRGQFFWHINHEPSTDWLAESYVEGDLVEPGQSAKIKIKLVGTILELGKATGIPSGRQFCLREGSRVVAVGVITKSRYQTPNQSAAHEPPPPGSGSSSPAHQTLDSLPMPGSGGGR